MVAEWITILAGMAACVCCLLAHLLALRHWLSAKHFRVIRWQKIHVWAGLASVPFVLWHAGLDWGWWYGVGSWLAADYWLIVLSGCVALVGHTLTLLKKHGGDKGKGLVAATLIGRLREWALNVHVPASAAFWPLLIMHVFGKAFF